MKIKVRAKIEVEKEIEVEFPLYISYGDTFDTGGWYETKMRIVLYDDGPRQSLAVSSITEHSRNEWEFSASNDSIDALAYYLDKTQCRYSQVSRDVYVQHYLKMREAMENVCAE